MKEHVDSLLNPPSCRNESGRRIKDISSNTIMTPKIYQLCLVFLLSIACGHTHADTGKRACHFPQIPSGPGNVFDPPQWPLAELESFTTGRIGIIKPSYDHFYLLLTYRLLHGLPIHAIDIERIRRYDPCWQAAADKQKILLAINLWQVQRTQASDNPPKIFNTTYDFKCNPDAFRAAADTLAARKSSYGRSPELLDWIQGQDAVFDNCSQPSALPTPVAANAPRWLQQDRIYQYAAALFYQGHYQEAVQAFDRIAQDNDTPWQESAPYLAVRALLRSVNSRRGDKTDTEMVVLEEAEQRLQQILAKPSSSDRRKDAERLLQFVQLRTEPKTVLAEISKRLLSPSLPESIGQDIVDFWPAYLGCHDDGEPLPLAQWLNMYRSGIKKGEARINIAAEAWVKEKQLPWLLAALELAKVDDNNLSALLADAEKISPQSPLFLTAQYHRIRLMPNTKVALQLADKLLAAQPPLALQDVNAIKHVALLRAQTLKQFTRYAARLVAMRTNGTPPNVDEDAASIINAALPLDSMLNMINDRQSPTKLRDELIIVVWARAFVLQRWKVMRQLAPNIRRMAPGASSLIDDLLAAPNARTRQAIAAMLIARYPGMAGNIRDEIIQEFPLEAFAPANTRPWMRQDGSRDNWWNGFPNRLYWHLISASYEYEDPAPPAFLSTSQLRALQSERQWLRTIPNGTCHIGKILLDWGKTNPDDPRLPEALHRLIAANGGCRGEQLSRDMFRHLHKHFPRSPWARKTRVYR